VDMAVLGSDGGDWCRGGLRIGYMNEERKLFPQILWKKSRLFTSIWSDDYNVNGFQVHQEERSRDRTI